MICESCYQLINFSWQTDFKDKIEKNLEKIYFDQLQVVADFKAPLSKLIKELKYKNHREAGCFLGQMLYFHLAINWQSIDLITFIPLHPKKLKSRGYNQCRVIAKELSLWTKKPCFKLLIRERNNRAQASIHNPLERQKNATGIFKIKTEAGDLIKDKQILLIDDVFTTGSTLNEAAQVLKKAAAKTVNAIAIASRLD